MAYACSCLLEQCALLSLDFSWISFDSKMLQTRDLSKFNLSYWLRYCVYLEQWFEGVFLLPWRPNTCAVCAHSSCVQNKTINMWAAPAITFLTQSKARRGLTGLLPAKSNLISKQGWSVTPNSALTTKVGEKKLLQNDAPLLKTCVTFDFILTQSIAASLTL